MGKRKGAMCGCHDDIICGGVVDLFSLKLERLETFGFRNNCGTGSSEKSSNEHVYKLDLTKEKAQGEKKKKFEKNST